MFLVSSLLVKKNDLDVTEAAWWIMIISPDCTFLLLHATTATKRNKSNFCMLHYHFKKSHSSLIPMCCHAPHCFRQANGQSVWDAPKMTHISNHETLRFQRRLEKYIKINSMFCSEIEVFYYGRSARVETLLNQRLGCTVVCSSAEQNLMEQTLANTIMNQLSPTHPH